MQNSRIPKTLQNVASVLLTRPKSPEDTRAVSTGGGQWGSCPQIMYCKYFSGVLHS